MTSHRMMAACGLLLVYMLGGQACDSGPMAGVEVVQYHGPAITPEAIPGLDQWTATVDTLWRQVQLDFVEADGMVKHRLLLIETFNALPAFGGYSLYPEEAYSLGLRSGTISIQHFDLEGEISGHFEGRLTNPFRSGIAGEFWVDLSDRGEGRGSRNARF